MNTEKLSRNLYHWSQSEKVLLKNVFHLSPPWKSILLTCTLKRCNLDLVEAWDEEYVPPYSDRASHRRHSLPSHTYRRLTGRTPTEIIWWKPFPQIENNIVKMKIQVFHIITWQNIYQATVIRKEKLLIKRILLLPPRTSTSTWRTRRSSCSSLTCGTLRRTSWWPSRPSSWWASPPSATWPPEIHSSTEWARWR